MRYNDVELESSVTNFSKDFLYRKLANCIRVLTIDAVEQAQSGHPGMPLGMADVATVLFAEFLNFLPNNPEWLNRDRFILSAGHGSMLLYSLLYLTGYPDIELEDIKQFRQLHSKTAGHPECGFLKGIETTTGPLGQGLANAVGMEIARNLNRAKLGTTEILDHYVYTIVGDGCLMEGISHEACSLAGHLQLRNLIVFYDSNNITIDGDKSLSDSEDTKLRFQGYSWYVQEIDGHDFSQIRKAIQNAQLSEKPSLIICNTKIAYGAPTKEGKSCSHGAPLGAEEVMKAKINYGWSADKKFFIPERLLKIWREIGKNNLIRHQIWQEKIENISDEKKEILNQLKSFEIPEDDLKRVILNLKKQFILSDDSQATRKASGVILNSLWDVIPFVGGSADLTESNHTNPRHVERISKDNWLANYFCYGVREHAMGAIMNGIALYGGVIPYGGSFLVFMDYMKPALRMAALMKLQVIYVMTHDSIGVGEDGPTHQPVEQLSYLRAIPNVNVFRPADSVETAECWELALKSRTTPSVLCLTRQKVACIRKKDNKKNQSALGAYIISEYKGKHEVTIFATGSEVSIAMEAQNILHEQKIGTRVISVPCMELLEKQEEDYKKELFGNTTVKIVIEAALQAGWERYLDKDGIFIGMSNFGASAPCKDLYEFFNINSKTVVSSVFEKLKEGANL
ncbi:MAG: transketolase [Rickettsiales bacterium]|nr:transketolase [Rickettsiales bacterium]